VSSRARARDRAATACPGVPIDPAHSHSVLTGIPCSGRSSSAPPPALICRPGRVWLARSMRASRLLSTRES
jgi:hypothetical protein